MKKTVCLLVGIIVLFSCFFAYADQDYSLPEKLSKQMAAGNGLKGSITLHTEGNQPILLSLQPFQDVDIQVRGVKKGDLAYYYLYQSGKDDAQLGLTEFYSDGKQVFFRSDMLQDQVYLLPGFEDTADLLLPARGGNPSLGSALFRWITLSSQEKKLLLDPIVLDMVDELELWVAPYAEVSPIRALENGTTGMDLTFSIPMKDVKEEILHLMRMLSSGEPGKALLDKILNPEQREIYANTNLEYYYREALDSLDNDYDLQYTRTVSALGDPVSSVLELPLAEERTGFRSLTIEERGGVTSYTLRDEERLITWISGGTPDWTEISQMSFWIVVRPASEETPKAQELYRALRIDVAHSSEVSTDEEAVKHLREKWTLSCQRDVSRLPKGEKPENYPDEPVQNAELNLHYFSRNSQSSPTTLEAELKADLKDLQMTLSCRLKTASAWAFTPFNTENAIDISALTAEELSLKTAEFLASAREHLVPSGVETGTDSVSESNGSDEE